jgi:simple sugar transport system ATP-binding protein
MVRVLGDDPRLFVALYPTRGLDARSATMVHALLRDARNDGRAVLIVSEDLDELFAVSDRVLVLYRGAVAAVFGPEDFRAEAIGPAMVGAGMHGDAG